MPTRPAWRGIAHSASQLHVLEEEAFAEWRGRLAQRAAQCEGGGSSKDSGGGDGHRGGSDDDGSTGGGIPVSFYEPRLEFWRQLWRVLEMADVVVSLGRGSLHFPPFHKVALWRMLEWQSAPPSLSLSSCLAHAQVAVGVVMVHVAVCKQCFLPFSSPALPLFFTHPQGVLCPPRPAAFTPGSLLFITWMLPKCVFPSVFPGVSVLSFSCMAAIPS